MSPRIHSRALGSASLLVLALASVGRAQHHLFTFDGELAADGFGTAVAIADLDHDGYADVIVGIPNYDSNRGCVRVFWGRNGVMLYLFCGDDQGDEFGSAVSAAGDVDRDGFPDLVVGAPCDDNAGADSGSARVFSGKDGRVLYTFDGDSPGDRLGTSVAGAGDVDGDGFADVIAGAPFDDDTGANAGSARVYSGAAGTTRFTVHGDSALDQFGWSVSGLGDTDGDGHAEFIVGAWGDDNRGSTSGSARVFSGRFGNPVATLDGDAAGQLFGWSVGGSGDVDGDGIADFVVGVPGDDKNGAYSGSARVYSGRTFTLLFAVSGDAAADAFGVAVGVPGDLDGDGRADLIVGAPGNDAGGTNAGLVRLFSGSGGAILETFAGGTGDGYGSAVGGAGDVNRDGALDVVAGARNGKNRAGVFSGYARVHSSARLSLSSDRHFVRVSAGGLQVLALDAGPGMAHRPYWLLGSISGTSPGINLGATTLPLNFGGYFTLTMSFPNMPPLINSAATLDAAGAGLSGFALPQLPPAAAGLTLHHAFLVYDTASWTFPFASIPVPVTLVQ